MYICNSFSLQMLGETALADLEIRQIYEPELKGLELESAIGHADTAHVLGFEPNRVNVHLERGDSIIVAQLMGGRLPEGATTLPDGFKFRYYKVTVKGKTDTLMG